LKARKRDIKVRELFRKKLDKVSVVPNDSVRRELMRKLEKREFLRFNVSRFNIWYLALITGAIISGCLILFSTTHKSEDLYELVTEVNSAKSNEIVIDRQSALRRLHSSGKEDTSAVLESTPPESTVSAGRVAVNNENKHEGAVDSPFSVTTAFEENELAEVKSPEIIVTEPASSIPEVLFEASAEEGCSPLKLKFHTNPGLCDSCRWTFGDGGFSSERDPEWIFDAEGEYKVVLTVFCKDRQPERYTKTILVHPLPVARFEVAPENPSVPGDQISFINYSTGAVKYKWNFGDGKVSSLFESKHNYEKPGSYNVSLVAVSDKGCIDSMKVENAFSGSEYFIRFPNAFIPNPLGPSGGYYSARSSESSDIFYPVFSGVTEYQLKIFSKLGILIFESNDINIGWDGYLNGALNTAGVYIWKVRGKFRNGESFIRMGDVTLLKAVNN
jgi:PKD repeat protein